MTQAATPNAPQARPTRLAGTAATPNAIERRQFLDLIWGPGWIEIVAGASGEEIAARGWLRADERPDPDKIELLIRTRATWDADKAADRPHTRDLFEWPAQARTIERKIAQLASEYDNVYVSLATYATKEDAKRRNNPQPGRVVLVEDGPADPLLPYSFQVETSPYSRHGYYLLDQALPAHKIRTLAEGAADRLHADKSGVDSQQLVRVPGTHNTKRKADHHRVTLIAGAGAYGLDQVARAMLAGGLADLHASAGPGSTSDRTRADRAPIDSAAWAEAEALYTPANIRAGGALLRDDGSLRRITDLNHFVNAKLRGGAWSPAAGYDATRSGWRYHLLKAIWIRGYPEAEIRMLGELLGADDEDKIGSAGLRDDIDRILQKLASERPNIARSATRGLVSGAAIERPSVPRARRGRPVGRAGEQSIALLALLTPGQITTQARLAAALGVTDRHIRRYLSALQDAGRLEIERQRYGILVVRSDINSIAAPADNLPNDSDQNAIEPARSDDNSTRSDLNSDPVLALPIAPIEQAPYMENTPPQILPVAAAPALAIEPPAIELVEVEPVEHVQLGSSRLPLVELVDRALALVEQEPIRKQKNLVRAIVQAERPTVADDMIDRALGDARDIRRLRDMPDRALARERAIRKGSANKAWAAVGINLVAVTTSARDGLDTLPPDATPATKKAWVFTYRAGRADRVWVERHGALPTDDAPAPQSLASDQERAVIHAQRDLVALQRDHDVERRARWLVEVQGIGLNQPKPGKADRKAGRTGADIGGCVLPSPVLVEPQAPATPAPSADLLSGLDMGYLLSMFRAGNQTAINLHCTMRRRNPADIAPLVAALAS